MQITPLVSHWATNSTQKNINISGYVFNIDDIAEIKLKDGNTFSFFNFSDNDLPVFNSVDEKKAGITEKHYFI